MTSRILVIHDEGNISSNPGLRSIVETMTVLGFAVDIWRSAAVDLPPIPGVHVITRPVFFRRLKTLFTEKHPSRVLSSLLYFVWLATRRLPNYELVVGVDRRGLLEGAYIARHRHIPLMFVSFEILFADEVGERFKRLERDVADTVDGWIVQDPVRQHCVQVENGLRADRALIVPIGSPGTRAPESKSRLRDRLGIPPDSHVVVMMGSAARWTMTPEILSSLNSWPAGWALLIHDRTGRSQDAAVDFRDNGGQSAQRVYWSSEPLPDIDDMSEILAGVDYGLALYRPLPGPFTERNLENLGRSSGKISTYARYGVPIITNEIGLMASDVREFGAGFVVETPNQIGPHLDKSLLERHRAGCRSYFQRTLDYSIHERKVQALVCTLTRDSEVQSEWPSGADRQ